MSDTSVNLIKSALKFDGNNDYVDLPNLGISSGGPGSVSGWFYQTADAKTRAGTLRYFHPLFYQHTANNRLYIVGTNDYFYVTPVNNQWNHLCMTWNGETDSANLYVNSTKVACTQQTGNHDVDSLTLPYIGYTSDSFPGWITNVKVFNVELTEDEVHNLYLNKGVNRGMIGHWKFNDSEGSTLEDSLGSYDGSIVGATWSDIQLPCNSHRWSVSNYSTTFETIMKLPYANFIRDYTTPGAVGEMYRILGRPHYYDKTWNSNNVVKIETTNDNIDTMRKSVTMYIKNMNTTPLPGTNGWLGVKLEGMISGSAGGL